MRTGVETHTHTTDAITYVFVSQHLFALLSASDNRVCVNDIPDRTHTTPPELWRGKEVISLKDCREVNTEEFLLTDHPSFIPGLLGSLSPLSASLLMFVINIISPLQAELHLLDIPSWATTASQSVTAPAPL